MRAARPATTSEPYAWLAGIVFVVALASEAVVAIGFGLTHDDGPAKVTSPLNEHHKRLVVIVCLSVVSAPMFVIYLTGLHGLLRGNTDRSRFLGSSVLVGGTLLVAMHGVSDVASPACSERSSQPTRMRGSPTRCTT